jgi:arylformamidase
MLANIKNSDLMKVIDLSHTIEQHMPLYPGSEKPEITEVFSIQANGFKESRLILPTHTGTHIDLPAHLLDGGKSVDDFYLSSFFGHAIRIDCRGLQTISKGAITARLKDSSPPDYLLFYSGWDSYWGEDRYFRDFPVLEHDAAEYIASLSLKGVGIDAISFDPVGDIVLKNHHLLMGNEILLIENLCNMGSLPGNEFLFGCPPLKIKGLDGCPIRAFAILES